MITAATNLEAKRLTPALQAALLRLLDDEDPAVETAVRERILECGPEALNWLAEYELDPNPTIRRRVAGMLNFLRRQRADNDFLALCLSQGEDLDLERAIWALAMTRYPEINVEGYRAILDGYALELGGRLPASGAPADEVLGCFNDYLFGEQGFSGNELNYYDPENSYLNRVLDRRMGNPVSLCLVYLFVARRLRLPISGIGMPGHFLCRYQNPSQELFIDAFNRGRLLSKSDCVKYLKQVSCGYEEGFLAPISPRRVLLRICANLHQIYTHLKQQPEGDQVRRYVVALAGSMKVLYKGFS